MWGGDGGVTNFCTRVARMGVFSVEHAVISFTASDHDYFISLLVTNTTEASGIQPVSKKNKYRKGKREFT